ncbi:MAG TPA: arylesterase [Geminicoccus sp.]|uniref:arylesterase n=1 Tax=Geminicoccus sp. TaxID=2024832 RepID=UPI002D165E18|nr:arylesterase [Geminicoccus sp.]HWL66770.1 arylesterase [Geminicoccus sp.]
MAEPGRNGNRKPSGWTALLRPLALAGLAIAAMVAAPGPATAQVEACRIAVLGDSLTAAYGLSVNEGFPARLEAALRDAGRNCAVIDAGVSGDTSAGGLSRADWVLADKPSHLIVELGANDALRALPTDQLERNLDAIIAKATAAGVPVFLAGMLAPPNLGAAYGKSFRQVYEDVADRHDIPLYPFFLDGVAGDHTLNLPDGIHPTAAGIDIIVERIMPTIEQWLDKVS